MRKRIVLLVVSSVALAWAAPALAQTSDPAPPPSKGGLTVCCGATFGYMGGSGSVSGSVVGPPGSGASAPAAQADPVASDPNAVSGGIAHTARLPVSRIATRPASAHASPLSWLMLAVTFGIIVFVYRRLPRPT